MYTVTMGKHFKVSLKSGKEPTSEEAEWLRRVDAIINHPENAEPIFERAIEEMCRMNGASLTSWQEYAAVKVELALWYDALMLVDEELHEGVVADDLNTDFDARRFFDDWATDLWAVL